MSAVIHALHEEERGRDELEESRLLKDACDSLQYVSFRSITMPCSESVPRLADPLCSAQ